MQTESVPVASIEVGDVIRSHDSHDLWMTVKTTRSLLPEHREGTMPGDPDEFLTAHAFGGNIHRTDGTPIEGSIEFNYADDLMVVRRL
ncbi:MULTISPECIES: hypothetical protein [Nocardia]|uniref:hypothetical protein n=1 Tax=Nocardia TaxID=1817 RepID=UPI0013008CFE|nr:MULTISPECIES: hypothetical protein [Nocardia]